MPPIEQGVGAAFGSDSYSPIFSPGAKKLVKPLTSLTVDALKGAGPDFAKYQSAWDAGTARQEGLQREQEGISRSLLARRLESNPLNLTRDVGQQLFGLIDPNVITPLAGYDVAANRLTRRAAGLNPAALTSTADRLRDSRIASGRYYDVAKQLSSMIPNLTNQVYNAGVNDAEIAEGYIPRIMRGYRQLDDDSLQPLRTQLDMIRNAASAVGGTNQANQAGVVGYQQDRNWADRLQAADTAIGDALRKDLDTVADGLDRSMAAAGGL